MPTEHEADRAANALELRRDGVFEGGAGFDEHPVAHHMAGAVETQNADQPAGAAVDRREAPLGKSACGDMHLVVGPDRPAIWILRSY